MNRRNAWRFGARLARSLRVPDRALPRAEGRLVLLSCSDVDRSMQWQGLRFSPLLQGVREIVAELGFGTLNLSHPYAVFRSDQVRDGTLTINRQALGARLRALARGRRAAGATSSVRIELEERIYAGLLRQLRPEIVFSIQPPWALSLAARRLRVPLVEVMHGTHIGREDRIYAAHMAHPDRLLPQFVLSFDDVTHATNSALCAGRDIVALRGNDPWLHACRRSGAGAGRAADPDGKRVLVTLQWGYDGERDTLSGVVPNGILHPALEAAIAAGAASGTTFLLRLHPIQANAPGYAHHRRYFASLAERMPHVDLEHASRAPLPLLLDEVSGHLTMSSSAVGEAAAAGVPSLMLCPTLHPGGAHHGFFKELAEQGWVTYGSLDANAIGAWIDRLPVRPVGDRRAAPASEHADELNFYAGLIEGARARAVAPLASERRTLEEARACRAAP